MKRLEIFLATVILLTVFASSGSGQEFYKNKTIRIVVGFFAWRWDGYLRTGNRAAFRKKHSRESISDRREHAGRWKPDCRESSLQSGQTGWTHNRKLDWRISSATGNRTARRELSLTHVSLNGLDCRRETAHPVPLRRQVASPTPTNGSQLRCQ